MLINDLEHLEMTEQAYEVKGASGIVVIPSFSIANFKFNSLVVGSLGSIAGGETQVLTTATPQGYTTGFSFIYQAVAIG
ncbi:hypothetical protein MYAER_3849 [Microcystis aeruginosa NIES-2549]|uniref:Uncharacterized protein n=3 Tax=Microcystis aeruginosa TaxID=1126 RepID=A0A0F6U7A0_MICAE|nr:hypothetical protein [Microcystis aeruginosa]AKE66179.1 hypothetical protein MYAER_3849 [Microcystis aeruginosa NIES-2549]AOC54589.1 hypothetical protein amyaer_3896 [Microcystis aeruginosa NIES-2481]GCL46723.1 hypothetical protein NIES3787_24220 [Microcystis aeruginosa NIES-3787]GCL60639.1 hypothetical protein NIES3807_38240 [Microcystis aeruginosa NIES-3807]